MTTILQVRSTFQDLSHLVADDFTNTFAFVAAVTPATAIADVIDFFNGPNTTHPLSAYLSPEVDRSAVAWLLQATDITGHLDGKHLPSPVEIQTATLGASAGGFALPDQVAATVGYHGVLTALPEHGGPATRPSDEEAQDEGAPPTHSVNSRPRASLRGRLYIGPLTTFTIAATGGNLEAGFSTDLQVATKRLAAKVDAWSVWSKTYGTLVPMVGGWVNQEFGTQRRRKDKAALRVAFTTP